MVTVATKLEAGDEYIFWSREIRQRRSLHRDVNDDLLLLGHVCLEESLEIVSGLRHHAMMG